MIGPDPTAVRVALWRALHLEVDAPPPLFDDAVGLRLAAPDEGWRARGDMSPDGTRRFRASIVARARYLEDVAAEHAARGVPQLVMLGAGLDTFAQRRADVASRLQVFEVDQPGPQAWKRARLEELGYGVPPWLHLVGVDFEAGASWRARIAEEGFDASAPALLTCAGVTMYLTHDAIRATLRDVAALAPGSTVAMTFMLPIELVEEEVRPMTAWAHEGARASGTPFRSCFAPEDFVALAREAGLRDVRHVSAADLAQRYFAGRSDGLLPTNGEELIVAQTQ